MTMPISFFKNTGELERINKLHSNSADPKVVTVIMSEENRKQHGQLLKYKLQINRMRLRDVMEKQTD